MLGGIGGKRRRGWQRIRWLDWHHWLDGRESEWTLGVGDGQGGPACCDSWGRKESDTTEQLNWTELKVLWPNILASDTNWRLTVIKLQRKHWLAVDLGGSYGLTTVGQTPLLWPYHSGSDSTEGTTLEVNILDSRTHLFCPLPLPMRRVVEADLVFRKLLLTFGVLLQGTFPFLLRLCSYINYSSQSINRFKFVNKQAKKNFHIGIKVTA